MKVQAGVERVRRFLKEELWSEEPASRWIVARAVSLLQFASMTAEGFVRDRLLLHASALNAITDSPHRTERATSAPSFDSHLSPDAPPDSLAAAAQRTPAPHIGLKTPTA